MQQITCLLIDDDIDDQEIFQLALHDVKDSIKCTVASSGIDALHKIKSDRSFIPDFIFLDLNMPRMNGKECLSEIKKIAHVAHVPVIIYTTSSEKRDIDDVMKLGAFHFLTKPASISRLARELKQLLLGENVTR